MSVKELAVCGYQEGAASVVQYKHSKTICMHVYDNYHQSAYVDEEGIKRIYLMLKDLAEKLNWETE